MFVQSYLVFTNVLKKKEKIIHFWMTLLDKMQQYVYNYKMFAKPNTKKKKKKKINVRTFRTSVFIT